jgi:energy-coupling factor transport system substrate-specific component
MSTQTTARERPRWSWTTRELLLGAAVSVGTGVALIPVLFAYIAAVAAGPFGYAALAGLFSIPPILTMLLVRRPGAVLFGALISALVLAPFSGGGWVYPLGAVIFPSRLRPCSRSPATGASGL